MASLDWTVLCRRSRAAHSHFLPETKLGPSTFGDIKQTYSTYCARLKTMLIYFIVVLCFATFGCTAAQLQSAMTATPTIIVSQHRSKSFTPVKASSTYFGSSSTKEEQKQPLRYEKRSLSDFTTRDSRMGFVRKVYTIFSAQMVCTIGITSVIMNNPNLQQFLFQNFKIFMITSYLLSTGVIVALCSNPELRYKSPVNFVLLGIHTFLQSISVGIFSSAINPRLVCLGTMHTLGTFLAITLYSFQPNEKFDLTPFGNVLLTSSTSLLIGLFLNFFLKMPILDNLISAGLAVLFASFLAYDTQKIVGGKHHKHFYSPKEYILAALNLYQDVINLFIQIMNILMKLDRNKESP